MNRIRKTDKCHGCGEIVVFIKCTNNKTVTADAEPVYIRQDQNGEMHVTEDGRFIWGFQVGDAFDDPDTNLIRCYEPHKQKCPGGGRKRRAK